MELLPNSLSDAGVRLLKPKVFHDDRGHFFESFNEMTFAEKIAPLRFCQDNQSLSKRGVLRGLHYQLEPKAQTKLVRVLVGSVWDVAVDLRKSSPTFGKWFGVELSAENQLQLLIPKGFGHGFYTLTDNAVVSYKVDEYYSKDHDRGVKFDDRELAIEWPLSGAPLLSGKDAQLPSVANAQLFG